MSRGGGAAFGGFEREASGQGDRNIAVMNFGMDLSLRGGPHKRRAFAG